MRRLSCSRYRSRQYHRTRGFIGFQVAVDRNRSCRSSTMDRRNSRTIIVAAIAAVCCLLQLPVGTFGNQLRGKCLFYYFSYFYRFFAPSNYHSLASINVPARVSRPHGPKHVVCREFRNPGIYVPGERGVLGCPQYPRVLVFYLRTLAIPVLFVFVSYR